MTVYAQKDIGQLVRTIAERNAEIARLRAALAEVEQDRDRWQQKGNDILHLLAALAEATKPIETPEG